MMEAPVNSRHIVLPPIPCKSDFGDVFSDTFGAAPPSCREPPRHVLDCAFVNSRIQEPLRNTPDSSTVAHVRSVGILEHGVFRDILVGACAGNGAEQTKQRYESFSLIGPHKPGFSKIRELVQ